MTEILTRTTCRACDDPDVPLASLLVLRDTHLPTFPTAASTPPAHPPVPLDVTVCPKCSLVQLRHTTPFAWLFGAEYWYASGVNETMRAELTHVVADALERVGGVTVRDLVLDIGANDGTLLAAYPALGPRPHRIAFEPSKPFYDQLRPHADTLYACPFPSAETVRDLSLLAGRVKIITAIAMAYDLEAPVPFFQACADLLTEDGILVVQFQDLLQMVRATAFDNIVHEHLEHYSLYSLAQTIDHAGLHLVDVVPRAINGGSLRAICKRKDRSMVARVKDVAGMGRAADWMLNECSAGVVSMLGLTRTFTDFTLKMRDIYTQVHGVIDQVLDQGGTIDLYGASTKGNTLIQVLGLDDTIIRQAIERSPAKVGRYYGQSGIPIVSEAAGREDPADLALSTIWQFKQGIVAREREYLARTPMLFPLPYVDLVVEGRSRAMNGEAVA